MSIRVRVTKGLKQAPEAAIIRQKVFVEEQGFIDEFDDIDEFALHVVVYKDDKAVATGRIYKDYDGLHAGRIAVLPEYRKQHIGGKVISALEDCGRELGGKEIILSAQMQAVGFYEKVGFTNCGDLHYDQDCPHVIMKKHL